ncbi:MAG TPA: hypothetical protein VHL79_21030 [Ramlibacter sp.]|jgi:hypothetical protein|nr:hypothetical protein [Ramlibacter sp.]
MVPASSRHSVLVTQPLSDAARRRLDMFFDVQALWEDRVPSRDELAASLQGKAGVLTDSRITLDADLIARLPQLRAVCHAGPGPHAFDLPACTRAGIRATSLPADDAAQLREAARAQRVWRGLLPVLQEAAPRADAEGRYGRWSPSRTIAAAAQRTTLRLVGDAPWVRPLLTLAADARVRVLQGAAGEQADVVLLCDAPSRSSGGARVVDAGELLSGVREEQTPDRTRTAAEDLVAALGFGRHGWHPPNLLNSEILCESCC